jgi:hypothetical protein
MFGLKDISFSCIAGMAKFIKPLTEWTICIID